MNTEVICQQHKKLGMNFDTNKRHESQGSVFTLDANWPRRLARMERKRKSQQNFLFLISLICTLGGLLFGYSTGVTNGASSFIQQDLALNSAKIGAVTGALLIGAALGAFLGGHLADKIGRRRVTLLNSFIFIFGTLASALAPDFYFMLVARALLGLAVGSASATVPVFLAELAPAEKRGQMVTRNELMIVVGQLIAFLSNALLGTVWADNQHIWRWMLSLGILPAIGLLLGTWAVVPESPRWLISVSRNEQALEVLEQIRSSETEAKAELDDIREVVEEDRRRTKDSLKAGDSPIGQFINERWMRRCILTGLGIALCQQITGVNSIMFYGTEILRNTGLTSQAALLANIANGLVSVLAAILSIWLLGRMARRRMLIIAQFGTIIVHVCIGISQLLLPEGTAKGMLVLTLCVTFLAFQQGSISPVTWLLLAEIFPLSIRGFAISLTTFLLWLTNSLVGILFPVLAEHLGMAQTFLAFAGLNLWAVLFSLLWLPETQGKSLEELEQQFKQEDWARLRKPGNLDDEDEPSESEENVKNYGSLAKCHGGSSPQTQCPTMNFQKY